MDETKKTVTWEHAIYLFEEYLKLQRGLSDNSINSYVLDISKYLEAKIIRASFINSLGCIPKPPIPNQLLLPFLTVPTPGINTKINRKKQTSSIMFALFK